MTGAEFSQRLWKSASSQLLRLLQLHHFLLDLRCLSDYKSIKSIIWQMINKQRIDNQNVFLSFIISNKQSTVAYEERSLDFRVLELPDSHSSRSEWPLGGWLCTSGLFKHGCTIKRPHWTSCYVLPVQTEHYLRRILTLGKPSHFSLHSGHSVFFEEVHHKARQCRQKLCPQFKVVGLTRMS